MTGVPAFAELVEPLVGAADPGSLETVPLSELPAGDYAVLAWLDDVRSRYPAAIEADLVARWDEISLHDVYALLVSGPVSGPRSGPTTGPGSGPTTGSVPADAEVPAP